ncbi:MAG: zinc-binding dehydrogenase, partial [Deltaproteobacteria bacterium]
PSDLPWSVAALAEPVAVAVHGLRRGGFAPGQRVLVVGAGSVGLLSVLVARVMGAAEVILTARHAHQAALGRALGAAQVLDEREASPLRLATLGQASPIDLAVETVGGTAQTLDACAAAIRPGGTISVLGVFTGRTAVDPLPLLMKEGTLAWSNCYAHGDDGADFEDAIRILDEHREGLGRLTTHQVPLEEIERAFALASDKKAGAVKVTVCA